jgi:hypothetical protein
MHSLEVIIALNLRPELARRACTPDVDLPRPARAVAVDTCYFCRSRTPKGCAVCNPRYGRRSSAA